MLLSLGLHGWRTVAGHDRTGVSSQSTLFILRTTTNSSRLVPMVP
jgi:hypothetical protein